VDEPDEPDREETATDDIAASTDAERECGVEVEQRLEGVHICFFESYYEERYAGNTPVTRATRQ
jgi:hypothetical protein